MAVSVDARSSQLDKVVVDPGLVQEDLAANLIGAVRRIAARPPSSSVGEEI